MGPQTNQGIENDETLVWLDAAPNDPALRAKGRSKARAHIRRNIAKKFNEYHKAPNQLQHQPNLAPKPISHDLRPQLCQNKDCPLKFSQRSEQILEPISLPQRPLYREGHGRTEDGSSIVDSLAIFDPPRSETRDEPKYTTANQDYCIACGHRLNAEVLRENRAPFAKREISWRTSRALSFTDLLGAGRVDPFSSYPIKKPKPYVHDLIDYSVTCQLPGLFPDDGSASVAHAWVSASFSHPVLFHALLFASSVHLDFQHWSNFFPNSPRALTHKTAIIQYLKEVMTDLKRACTDEVILAILILATHETLNLIEERGNPFDAPLKETQWVNVYGNLRYPAEHMKALLDLITIRGGLASLELPGLAETICSGDVVSATNSASKPIYPEMKQVKIWIAKLRVWAITPPRQPLLIQASGFRRLKHLGLTGHMIDLFDTIGAITLALESYLSGKLFGLRLGAIANTRNAIQHRLLSLPTSKEIEEPDIFKLSFYECCRLSALIYGIGVVFPIPNNYPVFCDLVRNLKISSEALGIIDEDCFLWVIVLGGIAALEKPERKWFVDKLATFAEMRNLASWKAVEGLVEKFLWLGSACSRGGRLLWDEVLEMRGSVEWDEGRGR